MTKQNTAVPYCRRHQVRRLVRISGDHQLLQRRARVRQARKVAGAGQHKHPVRPVVRRAAVATASPAAPHPPAAAAAARPLPSLTPALGPRPRSLERRGFFRVVSRRRHRPTTVYTSPVAAPSARTAAAAPTAGGRRCSRWLLRSSTSLSLLLLLHPAGNQRCVGRPHVEHHEPGRQQWGEPAKRKRKSRRSRRFARSRSTTGMTSAAATAAAARLCRRRSRSRRSRSRRSRNSFRQGGSKLQLQPPQGA